MCGPIALSHRLPVGVEHTFPTALTLDHPNRTDAINGH
ncbi:MAG: hypothetical protein QOI25_4525, partial [Mycobacterium sp.]|nr:hypothetical protein [Mycobacterium sp.]